MEGRCQCGAITFTTPLPTPISVYVCHCTECRHQSSSAFGISAMFPNFDLPQMNTPLLGLFARPTDTGRAMECFFCKACGARVMHRSGRKTVSIKGGCWDGLSKEMMEGAVHIFTKSAVVPIPEGMKTFPGEPDDDD